MALSSSPSPNICPICGGTPARCAVRRKVPMPMSGHVWKPLLPILPCCRPACPQGLVCIACSTNSGTALTSKCPRLVAEARVDGVERRLSGATPARRQALLLTAMEGFNISDAAHILSVDEEEVKQMFSQAVRDFHQTQHQGAHHRRRAHHFAGPLRRAWPRWRRRCGPSSRTMPAGPAADGLVFDDEHLGAGLIGDLPHRLAHHLFHLSSLIDAEDAGRVADIESFHRGEQQRLTARRRELAKRSFHTVRVALQRAAGYFRRVRCSRVCGTSDTDQPWDRRASNTEVSATTASRHART